MAYGGGLGRLPGEYTKVSQETEVRIPWQTYIKNSVVFMIIDAGLWVIGWLLWQQLNAKAMTFWRWLDREWWSWFALRWPWVAITLVLCWIGPSAARYVYRLKIEQKYKRTPEYTPWDPKDGPWDPQAHRRLFQEEEWEEESAGTYAVEGKLEPRNGSALYLKFDLEDYDAARKWHNFCKAVHNKGRNFSYTEAVKRHRLSDDDWTNIYGAFTAQHWAIPCGRRGTPELWGMGRSWVRMFAETPPTPPPA